MKLHLPLLLGAILVALTGTIFAQDPLDKISNSGKTRELVYSSSKYPMKINPKDANYYIYRRK